MKASFFFVLIFSTLSWATPVQKLCMTNQFASPTCYQESKDWIRYCSIEKMCFEGSALEDSKVWVKHMDGKVVHYKVTNWVDDIDWRFQRFSLLTLASQDPNNKEQGKLWLRYDPETQLNLFALLAYTPDGFDFQGSSPTEE